MYISQQGNAICVNILFALRLYIPLSYKRCDASSKPKRVVYRLPSDTAPCGRRLFVSVLRHSRISENLTCTILQGLSRINHSTTMQSWTPICRGTAANLLLSDFQNTLQALSRINHSKVVRFLGACLSPHCIILEFYKKGSLDHYMYADKTPLTVGQCLNIALDVSLAIVSRTVYSLITLPRSLHFTCVFKSFFLRCWITVCMRTTCS